MLCSKSAWNLKLDVQNKYEGEMANLLNKNPQFLDEIINSIIFELNKVDQLMYSIYFDYFSWWDKKLSSYGPIKAGSIYSAVSFFDDAWISFYYSTIILLKDLLIYKNNVNDINDADNADEEQYRKFSKIYMDNSINIIRLKLLRINLKDALFYAIRTLIKNPKKKNSLQIEDLEMWCNSKNNSKLKKYINIEDFEK